MDVKKLRKTIENVGASANASPGICFSCSSGCSSGNCNAGCSGGCPIQCNDGCSKGCGVSMSSW